MTVCSQGPIEEVLAIIKEKDVGDVHPCGKGRGREGLGGDIYKFI